MAQLHFSADEATVARLTEEAAKKGISLSRYIAEIISRDLPQQWPVGYLKGVVGSCANFPLEGPASLPVDDVEL